jgi:hypothetical protein
MGWGCGDRSACGGVALRIVKVDFFADCLQLTLQ